MKNVTKNNNFDFLLNPTIMKQIRGEEVASIQAVINHVVSPNDDMAKHSTMDRYLSVGLDALRSIRESVRLADTEVNSILDFPCGHGRVTRWLRAVYPEARITGADIDVDGVEFCASTFDTERFISHSDFKSLTLPTTYDLIWCGSLLTHLDAHQWRPLLELFARHTNPGGVIVFTTHGRQAAKYLTERKVTYSFHSDKQIDTILARYAREGFVYEDYEGQNGYGISISKPSWVASTIEEFSDLRMTLTHEAGWDNHQDVFACTMQENCFSMPALKRSRVGAMFGMRSSKS